MEWINLQSNEDIMEPNFMCFIQFCPDKAPCNGYLCIIQIVK